MNNLILILILALYLFIIGLWAFLVLQQTLIHTLISIELMLLGCSLFILGFSTFIINVTERVFVLILLSMAAAETGVALALLVNRFRLSPSIDAQKIHYLKG